MAFTSKTRMKTIWKSIKVKQLVVFTKLLIKTLMINLSKTRTSTSTSGGCVPSGYLPVYVGWNRVRFLIPTRYLSLPIFIFLLDKAHQEFGFKFSGGIVLPCEVEFFKRVLKLLRKNERKYASLNVDEILKILAYDVDHDQDQVGFVSSSVAECKKEYCYASYPYHLRGCGLLEEARA